MHDEPHRRRGNNQPGSVLVVVHTWAGEVLLLKRADHTDFWQSVTGGLREGESPQEAAVRELAEETGIDGVPVSTGVTRQFEIRPPWSSRFPPGTRYNREHEFRLALPASRVPVVINPQEHTEFAWVDWREAKERVWSCTNRAAIVELLAETT